MILQTYEILNEQINKYGCYFMSILFFANKYKDYPLNGSLINSLYRTFIIRKYMDMDCYIKEPEKMFAYFGLFVKYTGKHEPVNRICDNREIEILMFKLGRWRHFCAGTGNGMVAYDPMGCSRCAREGRLISKRIFKRL